MQTASSRAEQARVNQDVLLGQMARRRICRAGADVRATASPLGTAAAWEALIAGIINVTNTHVKGARMEHLATSLIIAVVVVVLIALILLSYVKAPPDTAYIVSGISKKPKVIIGGSGFRIPFLQRLDKLYLGQMSVDIQTSQPVPTNDFIDIRVDAVSKVRVDPSPEGIQLAAKNFLNKTPSLIAADLQDSLQGNMREVIGTLPLKDITIDRDSFSDQVMKKAGVDMARLGIEILSCNIQNVTDGQGLIAGLGADNTAKIKKDAAIAKAQADRDVAIAQAEATKAANDAKVEADTEIAKRNNELDIKRSELKMVSDVKKAEADAAYEIQNQEQQKTIQTATVNAQIAKAEREAELKQKQVQVRQQELAAEIEKKADADRYAAEKQAEAELVIRQKEAAGIKAKYEAEAAGIRARGEAEAEAARAKGLAEAEAMEKKAEAYAKYNKAAMAEMMIKVMPQVAAEIAKPLAQIDKITIIGGGADGSGGVSAVADNVPTVMAKMFATMKEATGVDLAEIMRADTYDAKVNRNISIQGAPAVLVPGTEPEAKTDDADPVKTAVPGQVSAADEGPAPEV